MVFDVLLVVQVVALGALIIIGGLVEGFGYGLSLGTKWPYHEKMLTKAVFYDPEIWHRFLASLLGINAIVLLILNPTANTISGLILIVVAGLFGLATLYVLARVLPSFMHGIHGLVAYTTFLTYLIAIHFPALSIWTYLKLAVVLHPFLLMIFLGGMVSGQRGNKDPISAFVIPKTKRQWIFAIHYLAGLLFLLTLAHFSGIYSGALVLALVQFVIGFMLFHSVNNSPTRPGILVAIHQVMALSIMISIVFVWKVPLGWM